MIKPANPIRLVAVICVVVTSIYVMWMGYHLSDILSSPGWCGKALDAERISSSNFSGLTACTELLKIQLNALSRVTLVYAGTIALCLLTLIVIVIAKGKLDFTLPGGGGANIGGDPTQAAAAGAQATAASAQDTADQISKGANQ